MADNQQHIIPTAELIRQYLEGKLDGKTMHALEKQALDDPFLADALEGYAQYPVDQRPALSELQQRLQQRVAAGSRKKIVFDYRWMAAAAVLVLLCITAVMFLKREKEPTLAKMETPEQKADTVDVDSTLKTQWSNADQALSLKETPAQKDKPSAAPAPPAGSLHEAESSPPRQRIMLRGASTFHDSISPLVVADGVAIEMDSFRSINPDNVADIKILKDASANAIYGARAANGAIIVTTKKAAPVAQADKIDTIHIGGADKYGFAGKLDSKVEGIVTGEKSNFSNYYTDDNVRKISGVVVDEQTGKRIPGVSVLIKGTGRGVVTDTSGSFALNIASKSKAELNFSSLGYANKNVTVSESTSNVNVALPVDNSALNEVVVTGYGNKQKKPLIPPFPLIGDEAYSIYLLTEKKVEIPDLKVPVSGTVVLSFTVMPDGSLQDFKILQSVGKEADKAAIQHVKDGPGWMPASNKKKATVEVKVPIELVKKGN